VHLGETLSPFLFQIYLTDLNVGTPCENIRIKVSGPGFRILQGLVIEDFSLDFTI
jgi:hypothetical protein